MNYSNLISFMASAQKDYTLQIVISYIVLAVVALFVIFCVLVNKNIIMKKDNKFRRFITHPLFFYSLKRMGSALVSILIAISITFLLVRMQDLRTFYCSPFQSKYDPEGYERFCDMYMESLGLSGSMLEQLLTYLYNIIPIPKIITYYNEISQTFYQEFAIIYLGMPTPNDSNAYGDIWNTIITLMPNSFKWSALATLIQIAVGYPLGVLMAKYQDKLIDKIGKTYIIFINAVPGLLYYYILFALFMALSNTFKANWLVTFDSNDIKTWIAPAITASFGGIAGISYWVRRYMLNEINSDYVKYARAKGLSENKIMFKHVLRNAIVPLSRSLSTAFISCLFGSYFIENLFNIDGFGNKLTNAVQNNQFMTVQGVVVVSSILSVLSYLIADIVMACLDPRISFE